MNDSERDVIQSCEYGTTVCRSAGRGKRYVCPAWAVCRGNDETQRVLRDLIVELDTERKVSTKAIGILAAAADDDPWVALTSIPNETWPELENDEGEYTEASIRAYLVAEVSEQ